MAHDPPDGKGRRPGAGGDEPAGPMAEMARYAGHGITLALTTAAFALLGRWVDGRLSTAPLFVLLGSFLGLAAGFYRMYRELVLRPRAEAAAAEEAAESPDAPDGPRGP